MTLRSSVSAQPLCLQAVSKACNLRPRFRIVSEYVPSVCLSVGFSDRAVPIFQEPELSFLSRADRVLTISDADQRVLTAALQQHTIVSPPSGAARSAGPPSVGVLRLISDRDTASNSYRVGLSSYGDRSGLIFVGAHNGINSASLGWFCENVLPLLTRSQHARQQPLTITVAGSMRESSLTPNAKQQIAAAAAAPVPVSVKFVGFVSDIESALNRARVFVSPIIAGTGINTKNVLALENGVPLITTRIGARALHLTDSVCLSAADGCGARIVDSAQHFADAISDLYHSETLWRAAHTAALDHITRHFSEAGLASDIQSLTEWAAPATSARFDSILRAECVRRKQLSEYLSDY